MIRLRKALSIGVFAFWTLVPLSSCNMSGTAQQAEQTPPPAMPPPEEPLPPPSSTGEAPAVDPLTPMDPGLTTDPMAPILPPPTDSGSVTAAPADPSLASPTGRTAIPGLATPPPPIAAPPISGPIGEPGIGAPYGSTPATRAAVPKDLPTVIRETASARQGKVVSAKMKSKRGMAFYEIEVLGANGMVTEMDLGPDGKAIPAVGKGPKPEPKIAAAASVAKVTIDQAIATAQKSVPGTVEEAKLSASKGYATWEVEIRTAMGKTKIKIDAGSGQIVAY